MTALAGNGNGGGAGQPVNGRAATRNPPRAAVFTKRNFARSTRTITTTNTTAISRPACHCDFSLAASLNSSSEVLMIPPWVPFRAVRQCQICHKRKACMMGACLACANLVSGRRIRICLIGAVTPAHDQSNLMTVGRRKRNS